VDRAALAAELGMSAASQDSLDAAAAAIGRVRG